MYGIDISINAGNYAYFAPMNFLLGLEKYNDKIKMKMVQVYTEEMSQVHIGQAWDLIWHNFKNN